MVLTWSILVLYWYHMNTQAVSSSTIKINLPTGILSHAKGESERIGISLQDFIRMLMATYFANAPSIRAVSHDETLFLKAQKEIQKGEYTRVVDRKALDSYLASLDT